MPAPGLPGAVVPVAEVAARSLAALAAVGLGVVAAVMMVAGHAPWDGPEVLSLSQTHGLHQGDVLAIVPLIVGGALAAWCMRQDPSR